jgi:dihydrofolate reductase
MPIRAAIVAMSAERVIGQAGSLPWHYPEDLKRFKGLTLDTTIIMGRRTWESIGSKALPGRQNKVITRATLNHVPCFASVEAALDSCSGDIWFIGGAQLYTEALKYCNFVDVTWVPDHVEGENLVYFPELDRPQWGAGPRLAFATDPRLACQRFTRC